MVPVTTNQMMTGATPTVGSLRIYLVTDHPWRPRWAPGFCWHVDVRCGMLFGFFLWYVILIHLWYIPRSFLWGGGWERPLATNVQCLQSLEVMLCYWSLLLHLPSEVTLRYWSLRLSTLAISGMLRHWWLLLSTLALRSDAAQLILASTRAIRSDAIPHWSLLVHLHQKWFYAIDFCFDTAITIVATLLILLWHLPQKWCNTIDLFFDTCHQKWCYQMLPHWSLLRHLPLQVMLHYWFLLRHLPSEGMLRNWSLLRHLPSKVMLRYLSMPQEFAEAGRHQ